PPSAVTQAMMQTPIQSISRRPAARAAVMASAVMAMRYRASSMSGGSIQAFDLGPARAREDQARQGDQHGDHEKAGPAYRFDQGRRQGTGQVSAPHRRQSREQGELGRRELLLAQGH